MSQHAASAAVPAAEAAEAAHTGAAADVRIAVAAEGSDNKKLKARIAIRALLLMDNNYRPGCHLADISKIDADFTDDLNRQLKLQIDDEGTIVPDPGFRVIERMDNGSRHIDGVILDNDGEHAVA